MDQTVLFDKIMIIKCRHLDFFLKRLLLLPKKELRQESSCRLNQRTVPLLIRLGQ